MKKAEAKENNSLNGFVEMINSINKITRKKAGFGIGIPNYPNIKLFEISTVALVVGMRSVPICYLLGNELNVYGKTRKLSIDEMDNLYLFIAYRNSLGTFQYTPAPLDFSIIDGNSHSYFINWNGINSQGEGGHSMPTGLRDLIDYCNNLVNI
jgi:hypothetical protein